MALQDISSSGESLSANLPEASFCFTALPVDYTIGNYWEHLKMQVLFSFIMNCGLCEDSDNYLQM